MPVPFGYVRPVDRQFNAPGERVDTEPAVAGDAVVTVPYEVVAGGRVPWCMFRGPRATVVLLDGPIIADHTDDRRLGHLRAEAVLAAAATVGEPVEFLLLEGMVLARGAADHSACVEVCAACVGQYLGLRVVGAEEKRMSERDLCHAVFSFPKRLCFNSKHNYTIY